jgi:hypothetical protein
MSGATLWSREITPCSASRSKEIAENILVTEPMPMRWSGVSGVPVVWSSIPDATATSIDELCTAIEMDTFQKAECLLASACSAARSSAVLVGRVLVIAGWGESKNMRRAMPLASTGGKMVAAAATAATIHACIVIKIMIVQTCRSSPVNLPKTPRATQQSYFQKYCTVVAHSLYIFASLLSLYVSQQLFIALHARRCAPDMIATVVCSVLTTLASDYVIVSASGSLSNPAVIHKTVLPNAAGGHWGANGFEAVVENAAAAFRVFGPAGGTPCGVRVRTSKTADVHACRWAVNGGPFNMSNGDCDEGFFIENGEVLGTGGWTVQFGVTGNGSWVVGTLNADVVSQLNVTHSVPGFSWLVRDGQNVAGNSTYSAPRTAVGVKEDGQLVLLEVDGCEPQKGCLFKLGRTIYQMAELLLARGVHHAINLDGGGSSTTVENGKVINHPTDQDAWLLKRERAVTTIVCVV